MWLLVWGLVLLLVHVQFRHCGRITLTLLKVVETTVIVLLMRLWYNLELPLEDMQHQLLDLWNRHTEL
jgi:hypothetical protein